MQTFILRLLVDPAEPEALRGALQPMPEGEECTFADEQALLSCLHHLVSCASQRSAAAVRSGQRRSKEK